MIAILSSHALKGLLPAEGSPLKAVKLADTLNTLTVDRSPFDDHMYVICNRENFELLYRNFDLSDCKFIIVCSNPTRPPSLSPQLDLQFCATPRELLRNKSQTVHKSTSFYIGQNHGPLTQDLLPHCDYLYCIDESSSSEIAKLASSAADKNSSGTWHPYDQSQPLPPPYPCYVNRKFYPLPFSKNGSWDGEEEYDGNGNYSGLTAD